MRNDAKKLATLATVAGLIGGVGMAGGAALYFGADADDSGMPQSAQLTLRGTF